MTETSTFRFFVWSHLPEGPMQDASRECANVAAWAENNLPNGPEKSAGMRKLLEAKDCFVRAAMEE